MADSTLLLPVGLPADVAQPTGFLHALLTMSLTAVAVLRPLYARDEETIRDFAWVSLNPAGQQMLHQPACPTAPLLTLFPTAEADGVFAKCCQAFVTGEMQRNQTYYQADGLNGYFLLVAQRYENLLIVNFTDTNDHPRSAVEDALRDQARQQTALTEAARQRGEVQRELLQRLFTGAPIPIVICDGPDLVCQLVNPAYQRLFPGRDLLGQPLRLALPELADAATLASLAHVYQTGETYEAEEVHFQRAQYENGPLEDGYANFTYQARRNVHGQVDGLFVFAVVVTQLVVARQRSAAQRAELQSIVERAPVATAIMRGPELYIELANEAIGEIWGRSPAQVQGLPFPEAMPEVTNQGFVAMLQGVLATGEPASYAEVPVQIARAHTGLPLTGYFNFTVHPIHDAQQRITGLIAMGIEVTAQVLARQQVQDLNEELSAINEKLTATNEELGESNAQLTRTNVDLDTFVYTASHDLKAPITNIESITLALRDTLPAAVQQDEMIAHLLDLLEQTTTRFQLTIGQLTDLSKLQLAHAGPAEPVPLAAVIESVRLDLAPAMVEANAQLTVAVAPDLLVSFSPANLRSAVYNLLSNAVKYRALDRPAQVQVRAFPADGRVTLEVQDNGLGLNAHQQSRLFGLFQRLHTHVEGTGVGLFITKRLVENGGGTIAVESQVDEGTTFTLTFPA